MSRSFETLSRIIETLADESVSKVVVVHHNGDPDAVGSALALQAVFQNIRIAAPLGVSVPARNLLKAVSGEVLERPRYEDFDQVVIVDTSNRVQLGDEMERIKEPIIIDHHAYHEPWPDALFLYVDPNKASCCELVLEIVENAIEERLTDFDFTAGTDIDRLETVGLSLVTGIWTDTAGFRHANPGTFDSVARLLTATGISIADILTILEQEPEFHDGRREANLKAAQRMEWTEIGDLVVATSHVSAYEASAARALTLIGADVAFCVSDTKDEIRASARARKKAVDDHGVRLGHVMNRVGKRLGFMGGGHDGAAGMNLPKKDAQKKGITVPGIEETLKALLEGLREEIGG
ncbi:MAG: DHH family phosphoesterase [Euryarchaeota archaeon]|nr:DHH family phosphoesterase [Euryarchaeota archaeon]